MDSRIWACLQRTAKLITPFFEFFFSCEVKTETDLSNICTMCGFLTLMQCTLAAPCKEGSIFCGQSMKPNTIQVGLILYLDHLGLCGSGTWELSQWNW